MTNTKMIIATSAIASLLFGLVSCAPHGLNDCPVFPTEPVEMATWELQTFHERQINALRLIAINNNLNFYYRHDDKSHPANISDMNDVYKYRLSPTHTLMSPSA